MSQSIASSRRAPRSLLLTSFAALLVTACGSRSILGSDDVAGDSARDDVVVPDTVMADNVMADNVTPDVVMPDIVTPDNVTPDIVVADVPDVIDAPDVVDVMDVPDVSDVPDVFFVDATDVTDVPDSGVVVPGILGSAAQFTILGGSTVSNTGLSTITGMVGVAPGLALVGIPAGTVVHAGDGVASLAQADTTAAYNYLAGLPCGTALTGTDLGGRTLAPGVYCFTSSAQLTGTLVLDGQGQVSPMFVFQVGSTLVTGMVARVTMINGARPCGVYWQVGTSATVGIASSFAGNIVALASVTLTTGSALDGRALARNGAVTMDTNSVSNATCPDPPAPMFIMMGDSGTGPTDAASSDASDVPTDTAADAATDAATDAVDATADGE